MSRQPQEFYIETENTFRSFFPGQSVTGRVIVDTVKEKRTQGIRIVFQGKASVKWTETERVNGGNGRESTSRTVYFEAEEDYFDCNIYLLGNGGHEITIPPGRHIYPFQFTLPHGIPSSFIGQYGSVGYSMKAIMKRSWKFDLKTVVPFTVNAILDLNVEPLAQTAVNENKHKNVCCLCCKSGPVGFTLQMSKAGFVPGECVHISAEINNQSTRKVNHTTLYLIQETLFHARGKTKSDGKIIHQSLGPSVEQGESEIWRGQVLKIPSIPPTRLGNCKIIDVSYKLKFELDLSGPAINLKALVPIIIGTIPLRNSFQDLGFHPTGMQGNNFANVGPGPSYGPPFPYSEMNSTRIIPSAPGFEAYPDLPPPTYFEAIASEKFHPYSEEKKRKGKVNEGFTETEGITSAPLAEGEDYRPNYITYGWAQNYNS